MSTATRTPSVIRREIASVEKRLADSGRNSLRGQFDSEFNKTIQPLIDQHNAAFDAAVAEAKAERSTLQDELREACGGSIPRGQNAASQNSISFNEAVVLGISVLAADTSFEGNIGGTAIAGTFEAIGYETTSKTPVTQVNNALADLVESGHVSRKGRGQYALKAKGRKMVEAAQEALDNPTSDED